MTHDQHFYRQNMIDRAYRKAGLLDCDAAEKAAAAYIADRYEDQGVSKADAEDMAKDLVDRLEIHLHPAGISREERHERYLAARAIYHDYQCWKPISHFTKALGTFAARLQRSGTLQKETT